MKSKLLLNLFFAPVLFIMQFSIANAAQLTDGSDAIQVIGQYTDIFNSNFTEDFTIGGNNATPLNPLGIAGATAFDADPVGKRLFVADTSNNRVLVYNLENDLSLANYVPDFVLGQINFSNSRANTTQNGLSLPNALVFSTTTNLLYVSESGNDRVVVFDVTEITNGENAIAVLGAPDFVTAAPGATQSTFLNPGSLAIDNVHQRLFVADDAARRVLVFDVSSITNGENAVNVIGQSDFTTFTASTTQTGLISGPTGLAYDSDRHYLFVANGNRVTVYDAATITDGEPAVYVIGQSSFTTNSSSTNGFNGSNGGLAYDYIRRLLYTTTTRRVHIYNVSTLASGISPSSILGAQFIGDSFTVRPIASTTFSGIPTRMAIFGDSLIVNDPTWRRSLIFNVATITDGEAALGLLGQFQDQNLTNPIPDFLASNTNNSRPNGYGFNTPRGADIDRVNNRLFVADSGNNRVLVFNLNSNNRLVDPEADFVLGQPNFASSTASTTQTGMNSPEDVYFEQNTNRLFVADKSNHRVLVFDTATIINGEPAVAVIGQPGFTSAIGSTQQSSMGQPVGLAYSSTTQTLYVAQCLSRRITTYNIGDGITNGENAVNVLGQFLFDLASITLSAAGMSCPVGGGNIDLDDTQKRLFLSDTGHNRVLVYDVNSITNGESAVGVLGQAAFTSSTATTTQSGLSSPNGIHFDYTNNRLFVADQGNNRILVFDTAVIVNGESAINVLGHGDYVTATHIFEPNTAASVGSVNSVMYDLENQLLYAAQSSRSARISVFSAEPDTTTPATTSLAVAASGTAIAITYDETLDALSVPTTTDFILTVDSTPITMSDVQIEGSAVTLSFSTTIYTGQTVLLSYSSTTNPIQDLSGNIADNFINSTVANNSTQTVSTPTPDPEPTPSRRRSSGGRVVRTPEPASVPSNPSTPQQQSNTSPTLPPSRAGSTMFTRNLTSGTTGEDVRTLQRFLNSQGYTVATQGNGSKGQETTYFGRATEAALKQFQIANNITPTGTMGPLTQARIAELTANAPVQTPAVPSTSPATPSPSTTQSTSPYTRDLTIGSRGSDVTSLQNFLIQQGYLESGYATGYFGQLTQAALIKFQQANNISPAVGYFGAKTRGVVER